MVIRSLVVGIATVRNRNMGFLTVVQTLLLLGAFWGLVSF